MVNNMKSMYVEEKYLVINEEIFIYIYGGNLRYMDNQGEKFKIVKDIDVDNIRQMILKGEIPNSKIEKSFFRGELFYFQEKDKRIKSKNIKSACVRYLYKKEHGIFSFDNLEKRLSNEEYAEFNRCISKKYGLSS